MIKAENIIIKEKYKGLKNLVLICDAMDEFANIYLDEFAKFYNNKMEEFAVHCEISENLLNEFKIMKQKQ
jgi:hypothetical protein